MKDFKKVLLLGNTGVGKTTYLRRVSTGDFQVQHIKHSNLFFTEVLLDNNNIIKIYEKQMNNYDFSYEFLKNFDGIIVMFDVSDMETLFKAHNYWLERIYPFCVSRMPIILVGNKIDLRCDVTAEEISIIKNDGFTDFVGISCKTGFRLFDPLEIIYNYN